MRITIDQVFDQCGSPQTRFWISVDHHRPGMKDGWSTGVLLSVPSGPVLPQCSRPHKREREEQEGVSVVVGYSREEEEEKEKKEEEEVVVDGGKRESNTHSCLLSTTPSCLPVC
ncbi:unnamed protein product [Pleuronectes platessa]|uniref:Uncharacterized protein n=1 Tax=Pleuronectes platessa TaxID=8262 RepID=A0A9N7Z992_PLEPL|nr:unnamed protein product [Pleuronectes platessa]